MQTQRPISVEEICRKLKPVFGKKIDEIYFRYSMAESKEEKEELMHFVSALYQKYLEKLLTGGILLEPPSKENVSGQYPLGVVNYAGRKLFPFALKEEDWPRHVCISGMSGSGKTTLAYHILTNFSEKQKPFLVFDWKKSFRPLINSDDSLVVFTVGDDAVTNRFKMNILRAPKGIQAKEWITVLVDLLAETFSVSYGVHKIMVETIDELFEGWKIYEEEKNSGERAKFYPTFEHVGRLLEDKLKKSKGRESTWLESALRISSVLTFGSFAKVVNYEGKKSVSVSDILNKRVIFEMNSLGNIEKKFFCEFVLMYLYKMNKTGHDKYSNGNVFKHAILVDEAHNIFLKDKTNFVKESVTDMIYREMREYGTSLICLDQHVSKLSDTVKGNSACHIAFQQQLPEDMHDISRIMQLGDRKELYSQLKVGSAIVKLSDRFTSPFLVEVDDASSIRSTNVTDEDIRSRFRSFLLGLDVEKGEDPTFNEALMNPEHASVKGAFFRPPYVPQEYSLPYSPEVSIDVGESHLVKNVRFIDSQKEEIETEDETEDEIVLENIERIFFSKEDILVDFIKKRTKEGETLNEIETKLRLYNVRDGACTQEDIDEALDIVRNGNGEGRKEESKDEVIETKIEVKLVEKKIALSEEEKGSLSERDPGEKFSVAEKGFLDFVRSNPDHNLSTVDLYKIVNLSTRKGNIVKNKLIDKGLVKTEEIRNKTGWKKFIKPVFTI